MYTENFEDKILFISARKDGDVCDPKEANHYFNSLLSDTIDCFGAQIKEKVSFSSKKNVEDDVADHKEGFFPDVKADGIYILQSRC